MEPTTIAILILAIVFLLWIVKKIWDSWMFWAAALALTLVAFPLSGGLSPFVLFGLILLRIVLVGRLLNTGGAR